MTRRTDLLASLLLAVLASGCGSLGPTYSAASSPDPVVAKPSDASQTSQTAPTPALASAASDTVQQQFQAALKLMQDHRNQEAEDAFLAILRNDPAMMPALTNLGILYAQQHRRPQAVACLTRAIAVDPRNQVALNWMGILSRENGNFSASEQYYRQALALHPDYAAAHLNLGILYEKSLHRPEDALQQYREYSRYAGKDNPVVDAWIKQLEMSAPVTAASGAAP